MENKRRDRHRVPSPGARRISPVPDNLIPRQKELVKLLIYLKKNWCRLRDSNTRPPHYECYGELFSAVFRDMTVLSEAAVFLAFM